MINVREANYNILVGEIRRLNTELKNAKLALGTARYKSHKKLFKKRISGIEIELKEKQIKLSEMENGELQP